MTSLTVENYVKAILQLQLKSDKSMVSPGALAARLDVAPGSVTSMLKTLSDSELARYVPYEGVELTEAGRRLAMRMLRRHRLLEFFLLHTLNLTWDQVHDEAEELEHAVSDFLVDRIDEFLGHPETDPHGSPIPSADGDLRRDLSEAVTLADCSVGDSVRIVRVVNQKPDFLRFLSDAGVNIGSQGRVSDVNVDAGILHFQIDGVSVPIALTAAQSIRVDR